MFGAGNVAILARLLRGSTPIAVGDTVGTRTSVTLYFTIDGGDTYTQPTFAAQALDSPATTSATTYKMDIKVSSGTGHVNRSDNDGNSSNRGRGVSTITLMEVAG